MSWCRSPIYMWMNCDFVIFCNDYKKHMHKELLSIKLKDGENADDVAFKHMAEHYHKFIKQKRFDEAELLLSNMEDDYILTKPILRRLVNNAIFKFHDKYGIE